MEDIFNAPIIPDELSSDVIQKVENELVFTDGVLSEKPLSLLERSVCEMYADNKSTVSIASYLGISTTQVKRILNKDYIKSFVKELVSAQYELTKEYRLNLVSKVIADKIKAIEENGGDFAGATRKDIVDLVLIQDSMMKEREKKELGTTEDTYITLMQQIIKKD